MNDALLFGALGLGTGGVYALLALGIVLINRGSGVVNFAQGAIGMFFAFTFLWLLDEGFSTALAFGLTVVMASAFGVAAYLVIMRPLRAAPMLSRVVATLGLLLALQALASLLFATQRTAPPLLPSDPIEVLGVTFGRDRLYLAGIAIVLAALLWFVYRFTRFGLATRAAAENEKGATLLGYSTTTIASVNWAAGCALAAVAGILISPITSVSSTTQTLLVIPALAAALVGGFTSFGITVTAALALGIAQAEVIRFVPQQGLQDALPFIVIIVAMTITGKLIPARGAVRSGRPALAPLARVGLPAIVATAAAAALLVAGSREYQSAMTTSMIMAIVALSVVVVTGYTGQASLCPMAFAGIGGLLVSKLADGLQIPFPISILVAGLATVPIGIIVGIPALRVRGINLAVITLGAAVAINSLVFQDLDLIGGAQGSPVPVPELLGLSLDPVAHPERFGIFVLVALLLVVGAVGCLRRSPTGRRMLAVRDNERAAAGSRVGVLSTKLGAFALSAFLAGVGGAIFGYQLGTIGYARFDAFASILIVVLCVLGGVASVGGAVFAGCAASGGIMFVAFGNLVPSIDEYQGLLAGIFVILTVTLSPDGYVVAAGRGLRRLVDGLRTALASGYGEEPATAPPADVRAGH